MTNTYTKDLIAYRTARDAGQTREARGLLGGIVARYEPFIRGLAMKAASSRDEQDELLQAGRIAFADAVEEWRCDPERGALIGFARLRIRSAFDAVLLARPIVARPLATVDGHGGRSMPAVVRRAEEAFIARHGRAPSAEELGVDAEDLSTWRAVSHVAEYTESGSDELPCQGAITAATTDDDRAISRHIRQAIGDMTPQEQRILLSRVIEDLDFVAIGASEGLLRGATTRIYNRCLAKIREALRTDR